MEQQVIATILQKHADNHKYNNENDLARDCYELGASYSVLAWVDSYCLNHSLYRDTDYS